MEGMDSDVSISIKVEERGPIIIFYLGGTLEIMNSLQLEKLIEDYLQKSYKHFIFHLGAVSHLSSSGIRVFVTTMRLLNDIEGKMIICELSPIVHRMFVAIELMEIFEMAEKLDDAVQVIHDFIEEKTKK
ncbi:MAG: hypothetical protein A2Y33_12350 [Spirochaetes bacterium GWF1_51_8]|nr:MAG: hypothetical protein A2Y33_12350 [Spirochaetes bacterium GWF1_51_8]